MRIAFSSLILILLSVCWCFGQGPQKYTPIKEVIQQGNLQTFCVRAEFAGIYDSSKLIFFVNQDDFIIPVQLQKKDLGAEKRFLALNLEEGDVVVVKGTLDDIWVDSEKYKGLVNAEIIDDDNLLSDIVVPEEEVEEEAVPFQLVEVKPRFNGGDANAFSEWVNSHLEYPEIAKDNGIQGRVTLQFTVDTDGSVSGVKVLRGIDASLDKEAVRVVSASPKWKPGLIKGKPVRVIYTFPVIFNLR